MVTESWVADGSFTIEKPHKRWGRKVQYDLRNIDIDLIGCQAPASSNHMMQ